MVAEQLEKVGSEKDKVKMISKEEVSRKEVIEMGEAEVKKKEKVTSEWKWISLKNSWTPKWKWHMVPREDAERRRRVVRPLKPYWGEKEVGEWAREIREEQGQIEKEKQESVRGRCQAGAEKYEPQKLEREQSWETDYSCVRPKED